MSILHPEDHETYRSTCKKARVTYSLEYNHWKLFMNGACILHFPTIQNANAWLNHNGILLEQTKGVSA